MAGGAIPAAFGRHSPAMPAAGTRTVEGAGRDLHVLRHAPTPLAEGENDITRYHNDCARARGTEG